MKKIILPVAAAAALAFGAYVGFKPSAEPVPSSSRPAAGAPLVEVIVPDSLSANAEIGKRAFDAVCAACHGVNGVGVEGSGPPLIHVIYEPSHHGDMAFVMAAQRGVQSHQWRFGDMPPQEGLTQGDIKAIIAYVREVQRANGIE